MSQTQTVSDNVYVGKKGLMVYVTKAQIALQTHGKVTIAARGVLISKALVVAHRVNNGKIVRYASKVDKIKGNDEKERDVPTLEIEISG